MANSKDVLWQVSAVPWPAGVWMDTVEGGFDQPDVSVSIGHDEVDDTGAGPACTTVIHTGTQKRIGQDGRTFWHSTFFMDDRLPSADEGSYIDYDTDRDMMEPGSPDLVAVVDSAIATLRLCMQRHFPEIAVKPDEMLDVEAFKKKDSLLRRLFGEH